jgi:hypothetical protein
MRLILKSVLLISVLFHSSVSAENNSRKKLIYVPTYFIEISKITHVPADILYALAAQETNARMNDKTVRPWPYSINLDGKPERFASYEQLVARSKEIMESGRRSFDVGLFQVNWKWHSHRVNSIEELAHPTKNGLIASQILIEQYRIHKNWGVAAGRYHNPNNNNGLADKYQAEFLDKLKRIQNGSYQRALVNQNKLAMNRPE